MLKQVGLKSTRCIIILILMAVTIITGYRITAREWEMSEIKTADIKWKMIDL